MRSLAIASLAAGACLAQIATADTASEDIYGIWAPPSDGARIEIKPCDDELCGYMVWIRDDQAKDGEPLVDKNNKDESLRDRPLLGLKILYGFEQKNVDTWHNGHIYNPKNGKTYKVKLELKNENTLKVRGCLFIFCDGEDWSRTTLPSTAADGNRSGTRVSAESPE